MFSFYSGTKMKGLYRLTNYIVRSGVTSRHWAPHVSFRFSRFPNWTKKNALFVLCSWPILNGCRRLLSKAEMSSQVKFFSSALHTHTSDEIADTSLSAVTNDGIEPLNASEREQRQTELNVSGIVPALPKKSFSLAAYVNESKTLRNLVMLGVNLSKIEERDISLAEKLVKLDFERDVKPVLLFLHHCDVKECDIGECITRNPLLLTESIDDMQVRVNYLESKRFSKESIAKIVSRAPLVLTTATKEIDTQLGYLQQDFMLSGAEVRSVVTKYPKIIVYEKRAIQTAKFTLTEFLGFSEPELKQILLADPMIYITAREAMLERFDFIHNEIGFSHEHILHWPTILRTRVKVLRPRHEFLKFLKRDQFDPTRENYVSPQALATTHDLEFCNSVAKVPVKFYNDFLKTR